MSDVVVYSRFKHLTAKDLPHPECSKETPVYELRRMPEEGDEFRLVEKPTKLPSYKMIQEAVGPSLKQIISRATLGDYSLIGNVKATYQDFVKAPRDLREVFDLMKTTETNFEQLPIDFKQAFNNNSAYFRSCVENGEVDSVVKSVLEKRFKSRKKVEKDGDSNE